MKIEICGSMIFSRRMLEIKESLLEMGHIANTPPFTEKYAKLESPEKRHSESLGNKIKHDLIRVYFNKIKNSDAVLIVNENKNNIESYIGGNSFLEMAFAHILNKKIFLLNPIPKLSYTDEIEAMQPIILHGDLEKISQNEKLD